MTASTTDVAIIGGGAAGCAVAYYLAEAGVKSTIIEREGIGSQASGFAAGGLNPLQGAGIPGPLGAFAWESFRMHHGLAAELRERTGIDYEFRTVSAVHLALEEDELPGLQETVDLFTAAEGFEAGLLEPSHAAELEPRITPNFIRAVYEYGNAALDSLGFTEALAAASEAGGASIRPGTVCGIEPDGNAGVRVSLENGVVECGRVVLALGPWSRRAEAWLDTYIPVDPLKGEILRLDTADRPLTYDVSGGGGSIYNKPDGLAWCGTTEEWRGFDRRPLAETEHEIRCRIGRIVPGLAEARLAKHTACLRPVTPDWLPILGRLPGYDNVYLATGAGKKGILLAPAIGKSVADLITSGETALPIAAFSPDRFPGWGYG